MSGPGSGAAGTTGDAQGQDKDKEEDPSVQGSGDGGGSGGVGGAMSSAARSVLDRVRAVSARAAASSARAEGAEDAARLLSAAEEGGGEDGGDAAAAAVAGGIPSHAHSQMHSSASSGAKRGGGGGAMTDFVFIKIVARLALNVLRRSWHISSLALLAIILFYWLCGGLTAFLLVAFAVTGALYNAGDRLLYHPDQPPTSRVFVPAPSVVGLPFESVYVKGRDRTRVHAFLVKQPPERLSEAPTVLFLHGNAGNIGHRLLNAKGIYSCLGCNVFMLEYRGYGHSDGTPSEEGLYMDAQAGLDYLSGRSDINASRLVVFGRSLGGGVALELAARAENREKIGCLLVENTFTSIPDIARALFDLRLVRWLPDWCYKNQFRSRKKCCRVSAPVLFISGLRDQLVPPRMMAELFAACGSEHKRMAKFPAGTHNETWACSQYYATIRYFLEEVAKIHPSSSTSPGVGPAGLAPGGARVTSPPPNFFADAGPAVI